MGVNKVKLVVEQGVIEGVCDERFSAVQDEFVANFIERGEIGASVSLTFEGETLVDLWGGVARRGKDGAADTPWAEDTVCVVASTTKGATAICANMLAERGELDLNAPVIEYWPEYGVHGKQDTRVSMFLDHSAGLPALKTKVKEGGFLDFDYMADLLANEEPFWQPGTSVGYHGATYAWTVGNIIRRATGRTLSEFFATEVAGPLGVDFHIGVPDDKIDAVYARTARLTPPTLDPNAKPSVFTEVLLSDRQSAPNLFLFNTGNAAFGSKEAIQAEIGSATGVTNGRAVAKLYRPVANGGVWDGVKLMGADTITNMGRVWSATEFDMTLCQPTRFGLGFMKSMDNRKLDGEKAYSSYVVPESALGHVGAGGSVGFADPDAGLSFGYVMNKQGPGILLNERGQSLVNAAYASIGKPQA
jgi:CubicO group peptidase (beta-lactamase class C family)